MPPCVGNKRIARIFPKLKYEIMSWFLIGTRWDE